MHWLLLDRKCLMTTFGLSRIEVQLLLELIVSGVDQLGSLRRFDIDGFFPSVVEMLGQLLFVSIRAFLHIQMELR